MVGSEGTLGFLTKLTVKLIPEPKVNLSLLMPFDDLDACIGAVPAVLGCGCEPTAVEFMEREVIACARPILASSSPIPLPTLTCWSVWTAPARRPSSPPWIS